MLGSAPGPGMIRYMDGIGYVLGSGSIWRKIVDG